MVGVDPQKRTQPQTLQLIPDTVTAFQNGIRQRTANGTDHELLLPKNHERLNYGRQKRKAIPTSIESPI
uniref:Uncharacterized protein n=1 Tax=Nelumbo nucifera TaxID=4432 RepID=A0A822YH07_NELNU|nr:TPA_asm: hypothetical protein HUJ06_010731 [Nelumbo nucifera]